jgi:hypothetical protein
MDPILKWILVLSFFVGLVWFHAWFHSRPGHDCKKQKCDEDSDDTFDID